MVEMKQQSVLHQIMERTRARVAAREARVDLTAERLDAFSCRRESARAHLFTRQLSDRARINIIAEFKRASPSKGQINSQADPRAVAAAYLSGGAAAISVLTEEERFSGSIEDLRAVRDAVELPVLRKDFICAESQLYESALIGADAVLLIAAALDDEELSRFRLIVEDELQMDALVEVHTAAEMRRAIDCGATLVGVNNRNLHDFSVSLETSSELAALALPETILVSESGLRSGADLKKLRACGFRGFLIGETLMRTNDPDRALRTLIGEAES